MGSCSPASDDSASVAKSVFPADRMACQLDHCTHVDDPFGIDVVNSVAKSFAHDLDADSTSHFRPSSREITNALNGFPIIRFEFVDELDVLLFQKCKDFLNIIQSFRRIDERRHGFDLPKTK